MHPIYLHIKQSLFGIYPDAEASAIAKSILLDVFNLTQTELYTGKDMNFPKNDSERLQDILSRLQRHEPLQYIIGRTTFCGHSFKVGPGVLIPRPETAELVEWIISDHKEKSQLHLLDIGTGSGCIPITLSKAFPDANVSAWDISEQALNIAKENILLNGANVSLFQVDVFKDEYPHSNLDVLVSNPPYITEKESKGMEANVLDWEPRLALFVPDENPLIFYDRISDIGLSLLKKGGSLYFEINQAYGVETTNLLQDKGYQNIILRKDMSGNDRMIKAIRP